MSDNILNSVIRYLASEADENDLKKVQSWREKNPGEFEKIKLIFENTPFDQKEFNIEENKKQVFEKIRAVSRQPIQQRKNSINYWLKVAAVFAGLITIGISLYYYNNSLFYENTNLTANVTEIILPDGSSVSLDKNSTLSYKKNWLNNFNREVELSGRAFFQIQKQTSHGFQVITSESQVEVLGTKFTVSDNFGKTQVVLNEGKIRVISNKINKTFVLSNQGEQLIISREGIVKHGIINKNLYFSWLQDKLNLNNCKVSETLDFLTDSYNLNFEMKDKDALEKHLFGSAPSDNPELIIEAIANITDKRIKKTEHTFVFE